MKKLIILLLLAVGLVAIGYGWYLRSGKTMKSPIGPQVAREKPLDKYTSERLSKTKFNPSEITIGKILVNDTSYISAMFYFNVDGKKVSGLVNVPKREGVYPVIILFRGYVDREIYETGTGTQHDGEYFVKQGFITMAPDFLGYGGSDKPSSDSTEERFQTYTTAMTLLESVKNLNGGLRTVGINAKADPDRIGIWGHSNGGQIALSVLEISGKPYPTVLWAPVSKSFPFSVLFYTDDFDDYGKMLRKVVADFEKDYDSEKYSLTNYFDKITAPIEIHQGNGDESVPVWWSNQLVDKLKGLKKDVEYFTYPGEDHNFDKGSWGTAISRSSDFFKEKLK